MGKGKGEGRQGVGSAVGGAGRQAVVVGQPGAGVRGKAVVGQRQWRRQSARGRVLCGGGGVAARVWRVVCAVANGNVAACAACAKCAYVRRRVRKQRTV